MNDRSANQCLARYNRHRTSFGSYRVHLQQMKLGLLVTLISQICIWPCHLIQSMRHYVRHVKCHWKAAVTVHDSSFAAEVRTYIASMLKTEKKNTHESTQVQCNAKPYDILVNTNHSEKMTLKRQNMEKESIKNNGRSLPHHMCSLAIGKPRITL